jgi:hypothetical protein
MDTIHIKILEDGTLEIKTSEVSVGNHLSADEMMKEFDKLMGGHVDIKKNPDAHAYAHLHNHNHVHAGGNNH